MVVHTLFVKGLILDGVAGLRYTWERFVAELILSRELLRRTSRSAVPRRSGGGEATALVERRAVHGPPERWLPAPARLATALLDTTRWIIRSPITSRSIFVLRKQSSASAGVFTTGSFSLNDVLSTSGTPVRSRNASMRW